MLNRIKSLTKKSTIICYTQILATVDFFFNFYKYISNACKRSHGANLNFSLADPHKMIRSLGLPLSRVRDQIPPDKKNPKQHEANDFYETVQ